VLKIRGLYELTRYSFSQYSTSIINEATPYLIVIKYYVYVILGFLTQIERDMINRIKCKDTGRSNSHPGPVQDGISLKLARH
jgi:hypothetical protein